MALENNVLRKMLGRNRKIIGEQYIMNSFISLTYIYKISHNQKALEIFTSCFWDRWIIQEQN
jgi:hypothetical protein